jgi:hypothetical protein
MTIDHGLCQGSYHGINGFASLLWVIWWVVARSAMYKVALVLEVMVSISVFADCCAGRLEETVLW